MRAHNLRQPLQGCDPCLRALRVYKVWILREEFRKQLQESKQDGRQLIQHPRCVFLIVGVAEDSVGRLPFAEVEPHRCRWEATVRDSREQQAIVLIVVAGGEELKHGLETNAVLPLCTRQMISEFAPVAVEIADLDEHLKDMSKKDSCFNIEAALPEIEQ